MEDYELIRIQKFENAFRQIRERQSRDLDSGVGRDRVALSEKDFQEATGGAGQNEHLFNLSFAQFRNNWLQGAQYESSKGVETKYLPKN